MRAEPDTFIKPCPTDTIHVDDENFENALTIQPNERFASRDMPLFAVRSAGNNGDMVKDQGS